MISVKKTKTIPVELIADYFIWKSNIEKKPITNKKLQKLLYYSQAWNMVIKNRPLFKDKIEAWVHGPAVRSVYLNFKNFGYQSIIKSVTEKEIHKIDKEASELLDEVWRVYGKHDADYLELLTHNEEPWQVARLGVGTSEASDNEISLEKMKSYYSSLINK